MLSLIVNSLLKFAFVAASYASEPSTTPRVLECSINHHAQTLTVRLDVTNHKEAVIDGLSYSVQYFASHNIVEVSIARYEAMSAKRVGETFFEPGKYQLRLPPTPASGNQPIDVSCHIPKTED